MILTQKMTDEKAKEITQLATDVLTMTLHGPLPMETVAKLAQGILDLGAEREEREREIERLRAELKPLKEISGSCRCEYGEYCENLAMVQNAGGELYDLANKRAESAESENAALREQIEEVREARRCFPLNIAAVLREDGFPATADALDNLDRVLNKKANE